MPESEARKRIAEKRKAELDARRRRERSRKLAVRIGIPLAAIVVIAVAFGVVANLPRGGSGATASGSSASQVLAKVTSVPASTLKAVGAGAATIGPTAVSAPALTKDGKPHVVYIGADYCPFCAAERWPMAVALSRFGTFSGVGLTSSSSTDVYPNTATLSFYKSTYTSDYVSFTGRETEDRSGKPLDPMTASEQKLLTKYDAPPYTKSAGSIPFVDIAGKYLINGASYDPTVLKGKTHAQIAAALSDPDSTIAQNIDGVANAITAAICTTTDQQPAKVCTASGVKATASLLK